ncbi:MAG: xanthine dehydrogenase molybdopterin binding subunit [Burkholderiales bacterium]|nr:xanthine dehydrogenase molybdopterin binding subunit [Burkholderiales bacterium]
MNRRIDALEALLRSPAEPAPFADHRAQLARRFDLDAEARRRADGERVGIGRAHESAHLHVSGEAAYIDDLPELDGTLHIALGLSPLAHGRITGIDLAGLRALPGVVAVLTAADIPGVNDCGPIQHDDPILAELAFDAQGRASGSVQYLGQPVFAIVATDRDLARRAAARAKDVLAIEPLPAVLTAREAHARGQYVVPPMHLSRGDAAAAIAAAPHRLSGSLSVGGQEQFYLEGQISYAVPLEDDGMRVHCSTQHPSEMQHAVAHALGVQAHHVLVECRRMGGGFGGKESQSAPFACVAAVAARRLNRPIKLRLDRDDDFMITGRRHGFEFDWAAGFDDAGRILGVEITLIANAGFSTDLTPPVMTRAICHFDNAYWLPHVAMHGYSARTNTQSNTAFRGFGGPQGALAIEFIVDSIARRLGLDTLAVRRANFYGIGERNVTPYGQTVEDNVIEALVARLADDAGYAARRAEIERWNAASPLLKRGIALTPVKFGISFNVKHFNQAGALVHVYADGSALVNHGGTEMGQGLNTKVAQVVAHALGIGFERVRCTATDTSKVANTSATAASTGADLNGKAAEDAARRIRERLAALFAGRHGVAVADVRFANDQVSAGAARESFVALVAAAYEARVQLWSDGFYATPGLSWDRETMTGHPFFYFAYGAAVSEVVVDTLTGECKLLAAHVLHDVGRSLNPAIDIGQIEGAFIQGMGWLTTEELWWHPQSGKLMTHAPSTYKIPTANDCPPVFDVRLYDNRSVADTIHRSKAVGEPPLLLPFSVLLAIRDAISAVAEHRVDPPLRAPATSEAILDAITAVQGAAG